MKKINKIIIFLFSLTGFFICINTTKAEGESWQYLNRTAISVGQVQEPYIAIDSSGTPYVAYRDGGNSNKATVMKYNGSSWETVGSAGFSAGEAAYTSIAFDSSGTPYVAYRDGGNSGKATVMKYNGSSWENVGSAGFSDGIALFTSLVFPSASTTPYVAYQDGGNGNKATVMKYNGSSWENVGSVGFSAGTVSYTSLVFPSASTTPYVVYRDEGNSGKATVMKYNGSSWENVGSAGFSAGTANYTSLVFPSASTTPYVAYQDGGNGNKATVMKYNGSFWEAVGGAGFSAGALEYISLAIDPSGTPYVAYRDFGTSAKATVMKYNGSSWENVGGAGFSVGSVESISIAIDPSGTPYVAYQGWANGKGSVMKYTSESLLEFYDIDSIQELYNVRNNLFVGYSLTRDLDFNDINSYDTTIPDGYSSVEEFKTAMTSSSGWIPIVNGNDVFFAIFNGNSHKISNLYINSSSRGCIGFFYGTELGSNITNIGLENINIKSTYNNWAYAIGGLVGCHEGTISDSYVTGVIVTHETGEAVGGLVGENYRGIITNSYSTVNVTGGDWAIGGLAGANYGTISNSYSTGSVSGTGGDVGGLVGYNEGRTITSSYYNSQTSNQSDDDGRGSPRTTLEMIYPYDTSENTTYVDWDFNNTWYHDTTGLVNNGYPYNKFVDIVSPTITILGSNPVYTFINESYTDSGATASDAVDGDITSSIVVTNTVDTNTVGTYYVTYVVSDTAGNTSTSTRTVNVINLPPASIPTYILESMNNQNQNNQEQEGNNNNNQTSGDSYFTNGSFIKTNNISTVYFISKDNTRHSYPSEAIWYSYFGKDFSFVDNKEDIDFSMYKLGKNVLFKKGTLFKIPSVPKVYLVDDDNGLIRWIKTEAKAIELYGDNWNKLVYDLDESLFSDYTEGSVIE